MIPLFDVRFAYVDRRFPFGSDCACRLRVWKDRNGGAVCLMTDLGKDSPGASVTNTVETIATAAARKYQLDPLKTTFVEHYEASPERMGLPESFDFVTFAWLGDSATHPIWTHGSREKLQEIIEAVL